MKAVVLFAMVLGAASGRAQQPTPAAPPEPLIAKSMPAFSSWTATYAYSGGQKDEAAMDKAFASAMRQAAANDPALARSLAADPALMMRRPNLKQRTITKTGDVRVEVMEYTNGQRAERWHFGKYVVTRDAFTHKYSLQVTGTAFAESDFPEFSWLTKQNFTAIQVVDGKKCAIFSGKVELEQIKDPILFAMTGGSGDPDAKLRATAIVDLETHLPVSVQCSDQTQTYEVLPTPTAVLTVPPEFVAVAQESERRTKIRNAPLSPP